MSESPTVCGAILFVGNGIRFVCELSPHSGRHSTEGNEYGKFPFFIMWEGDMRTVSKELVAEEMLNPT